MIDIWFLFLLILIVLTIVFHTVIAFLLGSYGSQRFQDGGVDQVKFDLKISKGGKVVESWISIPATRVQLPPGNLPRKKKHQSCPVSL